MTGVVVGHLEHLAMILCGPRVQDGAHRTLTASSAHRPQHLGGNRGESAITRGDDEVEQGTRGGVEGEEELLGAHLLVADGVEALGDEELAGEASHDMFVDGCVSRRNLPTARVETARTSPPSVRRDRMWRPPVSRAKPTSVSESKWKMRWTPSTALKKSERTRRPPWCAPTEPKQEEATW
ncbi:hypothetical protein [Archangium sp.]|uniref:hypothetical protein n=1 Tax=Archangium sp. TaxID=1872627 RepID=UPI002D6E31B7|nr:hypothetical protein [Archangium sp.]HYO60256.1 hypothetical protein [Archangium sp.]